MEERKLFDEHDATGNGLHLCTENVGTELTIHGSYSQGGKLQIIQPIGSLRTGKSPPAQKTSSSAKTQDARASQNMVVTVRAARLGLCAPLVEEHNKLVQEAPVALQPERSTAVSAI
ncbi:hypothetical protein S7711_10807 [Stachybotrys chartarum IBT 7711]|jgi:hypothetical protein|uniref:Uncharacterized protein n=1 Tax=Stachybotrys chartarum (strain CBS 109288 / IBT 7711) TaxID=1280523 RepID=A0A084AR58_STACB|nr:hypothetical protein S7711_10807 [Stachybotrys chartarum IBT 7711]KFA71589.1 hypothetical protein S40288_11373 [Stachybotrys chartarum IBT 40288]